MSLQGYDLFRKEVGHALERVTKTKGFFCFVSVTHAYYSFVF